MDIETAKKLNEALKPFGYTVGRIALEISAYESAIKICNVDSNFEKANTIEKDMAEIKYTGNKDVPKWKWFDYRDVLKKHGIES
ncbi:MAG: hypothetical protein PHH48_06520 [Eubacteriales bacterium]|nr:hypothetical protein [Eubacteriales bacterium]